jgi:hypothetical protein
VARITIHLDDKVLALVTAAAKATGISPDQWIAEAICRRRKTEWPVSVLAMAGGSPDFPTAKEIRKSQKANLPRNRL